MKKLQFDPDEIMMINRKTGKEIDSVKFLLEATKDRWEKVYAEELGKFIGLAGNTDSKILAYIIINRDNNNLLHGTYREIAVKTKTNNSAVQRVFKVLLKEDLVRKVRSGCYMVDPKIIRDGTNYKGIVTFKLWEDL